MDETEATFSNGTLNWTLGPLPEIEPAEPPSDEMMREMVELDMEVRRQFGKYLYPNEVIEEEVKPKPLDLQNRELIEKVKQLEIEVEFRGRKITSLEERLSENGGGVKTDVSEYQRIFQKQNAEIQMLKERIKEQHESLVKKEEDLANQIVKTQEALQQLKTLENEAASKENKNVKDPDATQIIRYLNQNPIDDAHRRSKGNGNSMSSSASSGGGHSFGSNECSDCKGLLSKVKTLSQELKERKVTTRRFMDTVEVITGYKVRLRDEDMVKVVTVLDDKQEMLFVVNDNKIELLRCRGFEKHQKLAERYGSHSVPLLMANILIAQSEKEDSTSTPFQETATYCQTVDNTTELFYK